MEHHAIDSKNVTLAARKRRVPRDWWLALGSGVTALAAPKCPLCVAAYLAFCGVTLDAASAIYPLLRPLAFALSALALGRLLVRRR